MTAQLQRALALLAQTLDRNGDSGLADVVRVRLEIRLAQIPGPVELRVEPG